MLSQSRGVVLLFLAVSSEQANENISAIVDSDCWSQPVYTHTHNLNTAKSYLTFPSTGLKIVNMTSRGSDRSSQFLAKTPIRLTRILTAGWFGVSQQSDGPVTSERPH